MSCLSTDGLPPSFSVGAVAGKICFKLQARAKVYDDIKGRHFQTYFYVISLLNKISFGILKETISFFLSMRAADMRVKGPVVSVCVCMCLHACVCLMHTVLLWFLCDVAHIFYLEDHFPLHIFNNKHETT